MLSNENVKWYFRDTSYNISYADLHFVTSAWICISTECTFFLVCLAVVLVTAVTETPVFIAPACVYGGWSGFLYARITVSSKCGGINGRIAEAGDSHVVRPYLLRVG